MNPVQIRLIDPSDGSGLSACFAIRKEVFCVEQGVPENLEWDGLDGTCRHFLALDGGIALGTARTRPYERGRTAKIERVAVLRAARRRGVGRLLMLAALDHARASGCAEAALNAQTAVESFYQGLGFQRHGSEFMEAGIPHVHMRLALR